MTAQKQENSNQNSLGYIFIGGLVGASLGLLSNPGTTQTIYKKIQDSEATQRLAQEIGRNIQGILTQQAMLALKQAAPAYLGSNRFAGKPEDSSYQQLKQENEQINERLEQLEEKIDQLLADNQ
ncbi:MULTISPECIES: hypothetical protein [Gracilibacillus]|uniref:hypothetical protein n=1 Tax=Gracilibacillus TaxID=74385 RepID=UPI0006D21F85